MGGETDPEKVASRARPLTSTLMDIWVHARIRLGARQDRPRRRGRPARPAHPGGIRLATERRSNSP